jgi:hypothetical protein
MHKPVLASLSVLAFLGAGFVTAATAQQPSRLERPRMVQPDNDFRPDRPRERCLVSDLVTGPEFAVTNQSVNLERGEVTFGFVAITDNVGRCRAGASRSKAILTLAGGRWLGQDSVDINAIAPGNYELVNFSITLPYADLLDESCALDRDDWVLTVSADFREQIGESNEANNAQAHTFTTATDSLCAGDDEDASGRRPRRPLGGRN